MSKARGGEFTDILVKKQIISKDQLAEAQVMMKQTGAKLADTLVKLGYCTAQDVIQAVAEFNNLKSVELENVAIVETTRWPSLAARALK